MPLKTLWYTEPHIRMFYGTGAITQKEFNEAIKGELDRLITSPTQIFYIIDIQDMTTFSVNPLAAAPMLEFLKHPQLGWLGLVGNSVMINYWAQVLRTVAQMRLRPFATVEDAAKFLGEMVELSNHESTFSDVEFPT